MDNYLMFGKLMRCKRLMLPRHVFVISPMPPAAAALTGGVVSTDSVDLRKLFPQKRSLTTLERHKANVNKRKTGKADRKSRLRKWVLVKRSAASLNRLGLRFQPVIVNMPPRTSSPFSLDAQ